MNPQVIRFRLRLSGGRGSEGERERGREGEKGRRVKGEGHTA